MNSKSSKPNVVVFLHLDRKKGTPGLGAARPLPAHADWLRLVSSAEKRRAK
jgi:hypothetical protein